MLFSLQYLLFDPMAKTTTLVSLSFPSSQKLVREGDILYLNIVNTANITISTTKSDENYFNLFDLVSNDDLEDVETD